MSGHLKKACRGIILASALMLQLDPVGAFEALPPPQLQYEKFNPFSDNIRSCTDKFYEQDSQGRYAFKGISFSSPAAFRAADRTFAIDEVSVFGATITPRRAVSYYRIGQRDEIVTILEWSQVFADRQRMDQLRILTQRAGEPRITDLLPEENYLTLLLLTTNSRRTRFEKIGQLKKSYDRIRFTALVSRDRVLSRFDDLELVQMRLSVDIGDIQAALKQMIAVSYAGIEMAEALGKGRRRVRECK